jgi:hypothetical protein
MLFSFLIIGAVSAIVVPALAAALVFVSRVERK